MAKVDGTDQTIRITQKRLKQAEIAHQQVRQAVPSCLHQIDTGTPYRPASAIATRTNYAPVPASGGGWLH